MLDGLRICCLQMTVGRQDVQPFRIEQVDLVRIFTEGGKAGRVPWNIESSADSGLCIQGQLRGRLLGATVSAMDRREPSFLLGSLFFLFRQRMIRTLFGLQEQFGQMLGVERVIDKEND